MSTSHAKLLWFNPQSFPAEKPADTYRVFCLGGSTTYGRPYDDTTSFCGWLRELLPTADPSRRWEVVNAGGISYASYRVAALAEEIAEYEPDLLIVYSGHNEFLEHRTYATILETPGILRDVGAVAARTRTYAALRNVLDRAPGARGRDRFVLPAEVDTILDRSVGPEHYRRDEALRSNVALHYRGNLERIARIARRAGADMLMVVPAANLADFAPFKSEHRDGLTAPDRQHWQRSVDEARTAFADDRFADALQAIDDALAIDDRRADAHFLRGRVLLGLDETALARHAFIRARDEDVCPLRALTELQAIAREVAMQVDIPLIDMVEIVARLSPSRIPGNDVFLDHVHPTIVANGVLASAIVTTMIDRGIVEAAPSWGPAAVADAGRRIDARIDKDAQAIALGNLAKVLAWAGKFEEADRLTTRALELTPDAADALYLRGFSLDRHGDTVAAAGYYERTLRVDPNHVRARTNLGIILYHQRRFDEAADHLSRAASAAPSDSRVRHNYGLVLSESDRVTEARQQLETAVELSPDDAVIQYDLGLVCAKQGDMDCAAARYRRAVAIDPAHADAHNNLGIVLAKQRRWSDARAHFETAVQLDPDNAGARANLARIDALLAADGSRP
jgi:Flp pilus assembly protein TadD